MRISVVVPAYNAARTIAATLDSLLAQSHPATQIIVVDDGSKDETLAALQPYLGRVDVVSQVNSGVSAARNLGVSRATGEWVGFCDADDLWHSEKLKIAAAVLARRPDVDLLFHDFWTVIADEVAEAKATHSAGTMFPLFTEQDVTIQSILQEKTVVAVDAREFAQVDTWTGDAFRWLMFGNFLMPSTVVVRRETFEARGGFDPNFRYAEDTEFFLRLAKHSRFVWVDASLTGYRREAGSLLTGNMLPTITNATRAVIKHCIEDETVLNADPDWVRRAVATRITRLAYYCLSELKPSEARKYARDALRYRPADSRAWLIVAASLAPTPVLGALRRLRAHTKSR